MPASTGTLVSTISNALVKVRYRETYVSEGLNKKLNGIIPLGVVRGGNLVPSVVSLNVTIQVDQSTGDSVYSYIDNNGFQLTHRQTSDITLDLTPFAVSTVYIALYIDYTVSGDTVAQWRAYTAAELAAETQAILVLGEVIVPGVGTVATASLNRQTAWETESQGMTEWYQMVNNGGFEDCKAIPGTAGSSDQPWPGWDTDTGTGLGASNLSAEVSTANPRSGRRHFRFILTGLPSAIGFLAYSGFEPVREGQRLRFSCWVTGTAAPGPAPGGHCGIQILIMDSSFNVVSVTYAEDLVAPTVGTYTEISEVFDVPSGLGAAFMTFALIYDDDNNSSTGFVDFDDVNVWLEREQVREDPGTPEQELFNSSIRTKNLDIIEPSLLNSGIPLDTIIDRMIQLRSLGISSGVHDLIMRARDGGTTPFDLLLKNGGLGIERIISDLGSQYVGSQAEMQTPRMTIAQGLDATYRLTELAEIPNPDGSGPIRVYMSSLNLPSGIAEQGNLNNGGIIITFNAYWIDTPTFRWYRDVAGEDSFGFSLTQGGAAFLYRNYQETSGWTWSVGGILTPSGPNPGVDILPGWSPTVGFPGGDWVDLRIGRGTLSFFNVGTNDSEWFSRTSTTYYRNRLSARNIVNIWAAVRPDGAGAIDATSTDEYGCTASLVGAGPPYDIRLTFHSTLSGLSTSIPVLATAARLVTSPLDWFAVPFNHNTGRVDVRIYDSTGAQVDADNNQILLTVAIFGKYATSP